MKELDQYVAPRWYMFAVLLNISKTVMERISRSFIANGNVHYSLSEVAEAWLEELNATIPKSSTEASRPSRKEPSCYWLQIYHVVKRMGHVTFATHLDTKRSKPLHAISTQFYL